MVKYRTARIGEDWKKLVNNEHLHDIRFDFMKYENVNSLGETDSLYAHNIYWDVLGIYLTLSWIIQIVI